MRANNGRIVNLMLAACATLGGGLNPTVTPRQPLGPSAGAKDRRKKRKAQKIAKRRNRR